jgi:ubiquitin C-terminal hydrolase
LHTKENCSIDKIAVSLLLKIIKLFYSSSLNKFQINKEVNKLIKTIKKSSTIQSSFSLNDSSEAKNQEEEEVHNLKKLKSMESAATFIDKLTEPFEDENIKEINDFKKLNSISEFNSEKKTSVQIGSEINSLEKIFESELGEKIIYAIQSSNFAQKIFKLLMSFDLKNKIYIKTVHKSADFNDNSIREETEFDNEDVEIIQNSFDVLGSLISSSNSNNNEDFDIQRVLISEEKQRKEFSEICLYSLISPIESIRESSALVLIRLTKILSFNNHYDILAIIFNEIFEFLLQSDKSTKIAFKNKTEKNATVNDFFDSKDLNLIHIFEFFSFIFDIYFSNKHSFSNSLNKIHSNVKVSPEEFIFKIAKSLENDINSNNPQMELRNDIFIGYMKILAKVVENNFQIKDEISEKFNLIQEIMTKILFKQNDKIEFSLLQKESNFESNFDCSSMKFINPESFSDLKSSRRKDHIFRKACYKFILSMLKNSVKNFEKFFAINILEDKFNTNNINLNKKFIISFQNNNNNNNESDLNNTNSNNNFSRQNSNNNNTNNLYSKNLLNSKNNDYLTDNASKAFGHVGLRNLGCICYMNSMLQQFFMVSSFRKAILQTDDKLSGDNNNHLQADDNAFHQVQRMFAYLSLSNREEYNPEAFCFSFKDYEGNPTNISIQQDAQEFLSRFLDKIEFSLKPTRFKYLIHSVFGGKICSQLRCESCNTIKKQFEDMFFLSLSVSKMKNIYESLAKFISEEKIDEYNCDNCNKKVTIAKRNLLAELPNVLIIHLQRIFYNYETDRNEKINSRLEFPKVLNLKDYSLEENEKQNFMKTNNIKESKLDALVVNKNEDLNCEKVCNGNEKEKNEESFKQDPFENDEVYFKSDEYYEYHLVGVNVHIGSADTGHYFSYINKLRSGEGSKMSYDPQVQDENDLWLKFNDSTISKFR